MPHPSRRKGNRYEHELVATIRAAGLRCERAFGSDGRALATDSGTPCTSDVDLLIEGSLRAQAKRRAAVASYLKPPTGCHLAIVREDRGESLAVLPLPLLIRLLTAAIRHAEAS
jgi:hypothetical protein